ncbi:hypothetical protein CesoFtcFv8_008508 [Champsocephalus esox]|uniref:Pyrin domain-containing protein n=1 Tax=Champsocephalus esox TaxID=159716 RepID=A0AAN8H0Q1_9TELE|nr:hypothetical protein CesoFtcFv8_008508 [Champsocephalus esox]
MVDELLLGTLDDLGKGDFQVFKGYLNQKNLAGVEPIAVSKLDDASRIETVSQMTRSYGGEMAVEVAVEILKKISNMKAAEELTEKYAEMNGAAPSSSSAAAASSPPAANTMSAQNESVIVPASSSHTSNINEHKKN